MLEPALVEEGGTRAVLAAVGTYGDTIHTLVERTGAPAIWLPGFVAWKTSARALAPVGLLAIDHCVGNVGWGEMETWCRYLRAGVRFPGTGQLR